MKRIGLSVFALVLSAGCSSLVDGPCASGYEMSDGSCVARTTSPDAGPHVVVDGHGSDGGGSGSDGGGSDGGGSGSDGGGSDGGGSDSGVDAGVDAGPDAPPSGPVCTGDEVACDGVCKDLQTDANNCGQCGYECASGICTAGHCEGEPWGHVVVIGHDYQASHNAQRRVLANAVNLGISPNVAVAQWPGVSPQPTYGPALAGAMSVIGRPWHTVAFPTIAGPGALDAIDVVIVAPEQGDGDNVEAAAAAWETTFDSFLHHGGVVVVLDGAGGTNYRFGHGAGLFDVGAPVTVTNQATSIVDQTDSVAASVVAPYLAESTSVGFPGAPEPVITTVGGGNTIVFHISR